MIHLSLDYKDDTECLRQGEYLRYHRTFQGFSTKELAEKVGIVPATITLYENGKHPIKYGTAVTLAEVLGIDRRRLLDEYTSFVDYPCRAVLQKIRNDLSLTQEQIADEIGVAQNTYSSWEKGTRTPRRQEYERIICVVKKRKMDIGQYINSENMCDENLQTCKAHFSVTK